MFSIIKKYKKNLNNICKFREKGVSLISLIVIIIVLLILAGVTIRISSGDTGLIKKTKKSVAMYQNASEDESETLNEYARKLKTFVEGPKAETIEFKADITGWTTKDVIITATSGDPDYEIELKSEDSDWSVRKDNKITVSKNQQINARLKNLVDKYSEDVATYNVTNIDKDAPDKTAPVLKATTNSITVTFKQKDDGSGIAKREYSIDNGATWKAGDSVFTFSGLTQGKKYAIITRATDRVENQSISDVSYITTETIPKLVAGSNLTFTPSTSSWTNSNVSVAVSTTVKEYTLQTSTDGKTWGTTNPLTYTANGTAYARLWDGNNANAVATINITNIDKGGVNITLSENKTTYGATTIGFTGNAISPIIAYGINQSSTQEPKWINTTNVDLSGIPIKTENDATWARIFYHNNKDGTELFASEQEALDTNTKYKFSKLKYIENFRDTSGKFEFMLKYPNDSNKYNRWTQTDNPITTTLPDTSTGSKVNGYTAIHIDSTSDYWGGLARSTTNATFLDGSVGHGYWFYAIGSYQKWQNGIPSSADFSPQDGGTTTSVVELWVRIDKLKTSNLRNNIKCEFADLTNSTYYVWAKNMAGTVSNKPITVAPEYTINYYLNGGAVTGNPDAYTNVSNEIKLNSPTKTGYTFTGWTGSNGTTAQTSVTISKGSTGNKTYTANWTINKYYADLNATLDGSILYSGLPIYADVYINGTLVSQNVDDYASNLDYGTKLEFKNIRAKNGYTLKSETSWSTTITKDVSYSPVVQTIPKVGTANASPTSWTNGNVTITLPTSTGFTTKYTTNGTAPSASSTTYSNLFTVSGNCTVRFVYTDGKNTNNAGTLSITNIDKTAPTKPTYSLYL